MTLEANRALANASPDGIVVQRGGIIRYANPAAHALFGVQLDGSLVDQCFFDLVHPHDRGVAQSRAAMVMDGISPPPRIVRFLRADGSIVEAETRGSLVQQEDEPAAMIVMRDVSERRQAEAALRRSEQQFRALLDAMAEGVVLQDETLAIRLWNPAAERILGLTGDQMIGRTSYDPGWKAIGESGRLLAGDEHYGSIALRTGKPASGLMGVVRPAGARVWIQVNAIPLIESGATTPHAIVVSFTDVTEIRDAAARVEESEARFRLLAEHSADLVSRRSVDQRFEYVSPSFTTVLGWTEAELLGHQATEFLHPDDAARMAGGYAEIAGGRTPATALLRARHKAGHYIWLEGVATPLLDADGRVIGSLVHSRDISERRALEEQMRRSQTIEVMARMAAGVAHDMNNVLTVVRTSTDLLSSDLSASTQVNAVEAIDSAIDRAAAMMSQLLIFGHGAHTTPVPVVAAEVVRADLAVLAELAGRRIRVRLEVDASAEHVRIDAEPADVKRVLFHLVVNARDAMPNGGDVDIRCWVNTLSEPLPHRLGRLPVGRYFCARMTDAGEGISDDVAAHLFEPFFTTKEQGKGVGLGLATVFGIVQQARGTIVAENADSGGAAFTVYWPVHSDSVSATTAPIPRVERDSASDHRKPPHGVVAQRDELVIVVDDEIDIGRIVSATLEREGYRVLRADSGAQALALVRAHLDSLRAIITDVRMPEMSGVQMMQQLLSEGIDLPVLFISGQLQESLPTDWPATVTRLFLGKPFGRGALARAVALLVAESRQAH